MADRGLEPPNMSADLWPIGFDVDIALDSSAKQGLNNLNCNILQGSSTTRANAGYADVQQMFFNKLDDLNERDISQITDLTNSLPKGESSHNLYTKFACHELANELQTCHDSMPKANHNLFAVSANNQESLFPLKHSYSLDIFGKVTFNEGKLTLQLRNFQVAAHFSNSIEECWICKEKLLPSHDSHKHTLHGLFQINTDYVQLDIDQYTIPDTQVPMSTSNGMKLPVTNFDQSVSGPTENSGDVYQSFGDQSTSEDCGQSRFPRDSSQVKINHKVVSTKSLDDISFTPSLVPQSDAKSEALDSGNFINLNLSSMVGTGEQSRSDVNSDAVYLLPSHSGRPDLNHANIYDSHEPKVMETYPNAFRDQRLSGELSNVRKSLSGPSAKSESTKVRAEEPQKKAEVGAKKRKSKLTSKKPSVIAMRAEHGPVAGSSSHVVHVEDSVTNFGLKNVPKRQPTPSKTHSEKSTESKVNRKLKLNCYLCSNVYKKEAAYIEHMSVHGVANCDLFSCHDCGKKFEILKDHLSHAKTHRAKISCGICGTTYSRLEALNRHVDATHNGKRSHKCHFCGKAFARREYLKVHLNIHTGIKFRCDTCGKSFSSKHNLTDHKKLHSSSKAHKCDQCDRSFVRRDNLKMHVQRSHTNKGFECEICLKLFSRKDVLKRHKAIHEISRVKHTCSYCKKSFSRKHVLSIHLKTHEKNISLKCDLCPVSFKKKESLQNHFKMHKTKEQCNICYKFMPCSQRLQNHLLWHEKQLKLRFEREYFGSVKCDSCPKSFSSRQLLNRHVTRSHKRSPESTGTLEAMIEREKKFFCEHCSKGFTRSCNLKAHLKTHTNESSEDEQMLAGLPSVLSAAKGKTSFPVIDKDSKYMRLENYTAKIGDMNDLSASTFPTPLEDLHNIAHASHAPYMTQAYENSPASSYLNVGAVSPTSPINLSAEAITAAAYLLAYPSYPGPYH